MKKYLVAWFTISLLLSIPVAGFSRDKKIVKISTVLRKGLPMNEEIINIGEDSSLIQKTQSWLEFKNILHQNGFTIIFRPLPWKRALFSAQNSEIDILFPISRTTEREVIFEFSNEPFSSTNYLIYVRKNSSIKYEGLESLSGKFIGVIRGWNYGKRFNKIKTIDKYEVNNILDGLIMLKSTRLDGLAGYEANFDRVIESENLTGQFHKLPVFDTSSEYIAGSKKNPVVHQVIRIFDKEKMALHQKQID